MTVGMLGHRRTLLMVEERKTLDKLQTFPFISQDFLG